MRRHHREHRRQRLLSHLHSGTLHHPSNSVLSPNGIRNVPRTEAGPHWHPIRDAGRCRVVTATVRVSRMRRWAAGLAWALWALALLTLAAFYWVHRLLLQAGRPDLVSADALLVLALVSAATVGAVLASRRPRHPVGWLLLALAVFLGADGVVSAYLPYGLVARPGALPAASSMVLSYPAF